MYHDAADKNNNARPPMSTNSVADAPAQPTQAAAQAAAGVRNRRRAISAAAVAVGVAAFIGVVCLHRRRQAAAGVNAASGPNDGIGAGSGMLRIAVRCSRPDDYHQAPPAAAPATPDAYGRVQRAIVEVTIGGGTAGAQRRGLLGGGGGATSTVTRYLDVADAATGDGKLVVYGAPDWRPTLRERRQCGGNGGREPVRVRDRRTLAVVADAPRCAQRWTTMTRALAGADQLPRWSSLDWDLDVPRASLIDAATGAVDVVGWSLVWLRSEGVIAKA